MRYVLIVAPLFLGLAGCVSFPKDNLVGSQQAAGGLTPITHRTTPPGLMRDQMTSRNLEVTE
ncbi:MAG TPA: hypothetical protein VGO52_21845 [Hyphomonadaceae bacterium]|jgi:hypothetical protein|nr:hypothetical protein [Hyphomonadaceae bacterium]